MEISYETGGITLILNSNISNESLEFSTYVVKYHKVIIVILTTEEIKILVFHFYFLNIDISLDINDVNLKLYMCVNNIHLEGTVSQFSIYGLVFIL